MQLSEFDSTVESHVVHCIVIYFLVQEAVDVLYPLTTFYFCGCQGGEIIIITCCPVSPSGML